MAEVDTSIYNALGARPRSMGEYAAEIDAADIRRQGMQKNALALRVDQQKADDANALRDIVRGFGADPRKNVESLFGSGRLGEALEYQKFIDESQKSATDTEKTRLANGLQRFEIIGQAMSGVIDQASYDRARQQVAQYIGPDDASKIDPVYNPQAIEENKAKAMSVKAQLERRLKDIEFAERVRKDKAGEALTTRGQNITMRGQDMTDARSRDGGGLAGKPPVGYRFTPEGDLEAIPGGPADAKAQAAAQLKAGGAADVESSIAALMDAYDRLEKGGGITSTNKGPIDNLGASSSSSTVGQALGRAFGTNNQSARNDIAMARPALLASLMKATGMSSKQMDSNAELKLWLATATDPTLDVEANRRALANIERKYLGPAQTPATAGVSVQTPDGQTHTFPTPAAAAAFKKAAGL